MRGKLSIATVLVAVLVTALPGQSSANDADGGPLHIEWEKVTETAPWLGRYDHGCISFADRLWIIGGRGYGAGDVWNSEDGATWRKVIPSPPFTSGRAYSVASINGMLYVFEHTRDGGVPLRNKIWRTEGGDTWELLEMSHRFQRYAPAFVAFDNKLWLIGGIAKEETTTAPPVADVWYSSDGMEWTCTVASAPWSGRYEHKAAVYAGELWIVGGFGLTEARTDVWHSRNGVDWELATVDAVSRALGGHTVLSHDGKLWVIANGDSVEWHDIAVWNSPDGKNWTRVVQGMNPGRRSDHGAAVHNGRMWITGGVTKTDELVNYRGDAWWSEDGANWTQSTREANLEDLGGRAASLADSIYITGGAVDISWTYDAGSYFYHETRRDVWCSMDGIQWRAYDAPWKGREGHGCVNFDDRIWVMGGRYNFYRHGKTGETLLGQQKSDLQVMPSKRADVVTWYGVNPSSHQSFNSRSEIEYFNDTWYSIDGLTWQEAAAHAPWTPRMDAAYIVHNGKLWSIGGNNPAQESGIREVWVTSDGVAWEMVTGEAPWPRATFWTCWSNGEEIFVFGSYGKQSRPVWRTRDGRIWTEGATQLEAWPWGTYAGFLWAFDWYHYGEGTIPAWYSRDGLSWTETESPFVGYYGASEMVHFGRDAWFVPIAASVWRMRACDSFAADPPPPVHSADYEGPDNEISLSELLRVVFLFNSGDYECAGDGEITDDGYVGGKGDGKCCAPHSADYHPDGPDFRIDIVELLRIIQMYNMGGYSHCPGGSEDDYCPAHYQERGSAV